ncbi:MAG: DUF2231 domain-containing protein [Nitrospinales bacterium]
MISSVTFHPFISHFPTALFVAGICLLVLANKRENPGLTAAASFNFSAGFLMSVLATITGLVSSDLNLRTTVEIQGHQGFSLAFVFFYGFSAAYSYIRAFSNTAIIYYCLTFLAMCASVYSGYLLVFDGAG